MAKPGQAGDQRLAGPPELAELVVSRWQIVASRCLRVTNKLGILDWPVHPVRTRRRVGLAALIYGIIVSTALWAWPQMANYPDLVPSPKSDLSITNIWPDPLSQEHIDYYYHLSRRNFGSPRPTYEMITIPAGKVILGSGPFEPRARTNEMPQHEVYVDAFEIDKYEVTNEQYYEFVRATGVPPLVCWGKSGKPAKVMLWHPAIGVSFAQAQAYAKWAGKRLPTEAEWVRAARGDTTQMYPWGDTDPTQIYPRPHRETTTSYYVEDAPAVVGAIAGDCSFYGAMDMGSNVAEWIADTHTTSPGCPEPEGGDPNVKVVKGRGFWGWLSEARCAGRRPMPADQPTVAVGFRCVRSTDQ